MRIFLLLLFSITFANAKSNLDVINLTSKNTISFSQRVTQVYVAKKLVEFRNLVSKLGPNEPIFLVLSTPGGSISAGNQFINTIRAYPNPVHTITLFAASMGYHFVQSLDKRLILPNGILMSHRAYLSGVSGQLNGELNTIINFYQALTQSMDVLASKRVGMSLSQYQKLIQNEYWVFGQNAVKSNHADAVVRAKCDSSLNGTHIIEYNTMFGLYKVQFFKLPVNYRTG